MSWKPKEPSKIEEIATFILVPAIAIALCVCFVAIGIL